MVARSARSCGTSWPPPGASISQPANGLGAPPAPALASEAGLGTLSQEQHSWAASLLAPRGLQGACPRRPRSRLPWDPGPCRGEHRFLGQAPAAQPDHSDTGTSREEHSRTNGPSGLPTVSLGSGLGVRLRGDLVRTCVSRMGSGLGLPRSRAGVRPVLCQLCVGGLVWSPKTETERFAATQVT